MLDLDGQRLMLANDTHGRTTLPSIVGYDPDTQARLRGYPAWHRRGLDPEPIQSVKRKMGLDQTLTLGPDSLSPAEVSAEILRATQTHLSNFVQRRGRSDHRLGRAVITVPAYFDAPQIDATRQAGEIAGLEVLGLLQEPTAACMYAVWKRDLGDGNFLVYDLGGGTFDVSVIRCLYGEYQVLGIHGDNYLGGDDFDRRLAEYFRKHLVDAGYSLELDIQNNADDRIRFLLLTRMAREVKEALSSSPVQYIARRDIFSDHEGKMVTLELELGRNTWNELMGDLIESTIRCSHEALKRAQEQGDITLADIDHVLLVGGSTRVPLVQERVAEAFCGPDKSKASAPIMEAPDSAVALGAALHAANLGGVAIGDEALDLQLLITSPLASRRDTLQIVGQLKGADARDAHTLILLDDTGATLAAQGLEDEHRFKLSDVPLTEDGQVSFGVEVLDANGQTIHTFDVPVTYSADAKRTGSALSNPTVLAKDIYMEVNRQGRLDRQVLLPRGRSLPAKGVFRFFTGDQSGAVLLTLLQNRFPINTIHLSVPKELPVGTPVDFTIEVDETMALTASGEVAGQSFWAQIEAPPPKQLRDWSSIEALIDEADELGKTLWGHEATYFRQVAPFLINNIREAVRTDPDKMHVLVGRLEQLLEGLRGHATALTPGMDRFNHVLDDIRRIVLRHDNLLGLNFDGWQERLRGLQADGISAFDARDQSRWTRCNTQAQAIFESVFQEEHRFVRTDSPEYVLTLFLRAQHRLSELTTRLDDVVLPANDETRRLHQRVLDELRSDLDTQIRQPLQTLPDDITTAPNARATLERINQSARQIDKRLNQLPNLGVVVSHES